MVVIAIRIRDQLLERKNQMQIESMGLMNSSESNTSVNIQQTGYGMESQYAYVASYQPQQLYSDGLNLNYRDNLIPPVSSQEDLL